MARLECPKCGSEFDKEALPTYGIMGLSGLAFGFNITFPKWPFVLKLYAKCPVCNKKGWIKVLKPQSVTKVLGIQKP